MAENIEALRYSLAPPGAQISAEEILRRQQELEQELTVLLDSDRLRQCDLVPVIQAGSDAPLSVVFQLRAKAQMPLNLFTESMSPDARGSIIDGQVSDWRALQSSGKATQERINHLAVAATAASGRGVVYSGGDMPGDKDLWALMVKHRSSTLALITPGGQLRLNFPNLPMFRSDGQIRSIDAVIDNVGRFRANLKGIQDSLFPRVKGERAINRLLYLTGADERMNRLLLTEGMSLNRRIKLLVRTAIDEARGRPHHYELVGIPDREYLSQSILALFST